MSRTKEREVDTLKDDKFLDFIETANYHNPKPEVSSQKAEEVYALIMQQDHSVLNNVLLSALSPELIENEEQKRDFKEQLMTFITRMLWVQLTVVSVPVILSYAAVTFKLPLSRTLITKDINIIFDFLKYYITAVIGEFIAMLFFIVKYVFDKSIVDLISHYVKK